MKPRLVTERRLAALARRYKHRHPERTVLIYHGAVWYREGWRDTAVWAITVCDSLIRCFRKENHGESCLIAGAKHAPADAVEITAEGGMA